MKRTSDFINRVINIIKKPEMQILPGQLAFYFLLSMIPLFAVAGAFASAFSISVESLQHFVVSSFPANTAEIILPLVSGKSINLNMTIFFISAFVLASNGSISIINTSNAIYKIDNNDFIKRRLKSILMTFILVLLLIFILLVPAFGDLLFKLIPNASSALFNLYQIFKYPISFILIYFNIKLLYTIAPSKVIKSNQTTYGAIFTTIAWILITEVYSIYTKVFTGYNIFYGSISNILILFLWIYFLAYVFVMGLALNAGRNDGDN